MSTTAAICAPLDTLRYLPESKTPVLDLIGDLPVPVSRRGLVFDYDMRPAFGPGAPTLILELPGLAVYRWPDGSTMMQAVDRTPRFDRAFGSIESLGCTRIDRVFPYCPRRRDDADGYEDD